MSEDNLFSGRGEIADQSKGTRNFQGRAPSLT